jgi:hypothetical protein
VAAGALRVELFELADQAGQTGEAMLVFSQLTGLGAADCRQPHWLGQRAAEHVGQLPQRDQRRHRPPLASVNHIGQGEAFGDDWLASGVGVNELELAALNQCSDDDDGV